MRGRYGEVKNELKEPFRRRAAPGRALYPEFLPEGTRLRSAKSGKSLYPGSALSGKNIHCPDGLCPRDRGKSASKAAKRYIRGALYPSSTVLKISTNSRPKFATKLPEIVLHTLQRDFPLITIT